MSRQTRLIPRIWQADGCRQGSTRHALPLACAILLVPATGWTEPVPVETTIIGPFTGHYAPLHPDNVTPIRARYYGTDLGWSYEHGGRIHFIFGDTNATEDDERIQASTGGLYDDAFGTIDLADWPDASKIAPGNIPRIRLGQNPGTDEVAAINPGHAMEGFKTPIGAFSNGTREFGIFYTGKPRACAGDADCGADLACDSGLGTLGEPWNSDRGATFGCLDGSPYCLNDPFMDATGAPVPGSGLCVDRGSSVWRNSEAGRFASIALKHLVGIRSLDDARNYTDTREWLSNRFANAAARTVHAFDPANPQRADYRPARAPSAQARVLLWGRPGFIGVGATGRPLGLYFAMADLPPGPGFDWKLQYYAGAGPDGRPRFSPNERDAQPADLDAALPGIQPEQHDIVDQMSLSWVEPLGRWVMFYGGGMVNNPTPELPRCGVLEFFTRDDCARVVVGNGAIRMRSAQHPWGPWSAPVDVLVGGDPRRLPPEHQYAPGGVLRHPACTASDCETHTRSNEVSPDEYGFLYGVNIIEQWTRAVDGGAELFWNLSTWDPYRVVLVRTRIRK